MYSKKFTKRYFFIRKILQNEIGMKLCHIKSYKIIVISGPQRKVPFCCLTPSNYINSSAGEVGSAEE